MRLKSRVIVLSLALCGWNGAAWTAEHPHEHPQGSEEHPTEMKKPMQEHSKEHPKKGVSNKAFQESFETVVKDYLKSEAQKTGGVYTIRDEVLGKAWKLELTKVHKSKICMLQGGKLCFACADLKEVGGKNKLDLDFYADHSEDGKMTINKVLIHKLNGKPRFTYDSNNAVVPVKSK
ncbi:MAG: hypothetical protein HYY63_07300 [Elusimicrobia bacterium]|nr:hypothetical protein [Elusimicrobiota bacterium]